MLLKKENKISTGLNHFFWRGRQSCDEKLDGGHRWAYSPDSLPSIWIPYQELNDQNGAAFFIFAFLISSTIFILPSSSDALLKSLILQVFDNNFLATFWFAQLLKGVFTAFEYFSHCFSVFSRKHLAKQEEFLTFTANVFLNVSVQPNIVIMKASKNIAIIVCQYACT